MYKQLCLIIFFCIINFGFNNIFSQGYTSTEGYFSYPLLQPHSLSGSFGELRTNHFHSGLDYSGRGKEGGNIYAVADGYVSRILVSPRGYGNALYITHPNGYVSVYAHLKDFADTISKFIRWQQYKEKTFYINYFPNKSHFIVKKGEIIGYMGNTGGSTGPHLHFEIREETSEHVVNPALFGFKVHDTKAPAIRALKIIPLDKNTLINGKNKPLKINVKQKNNSFEAVLQEKIIISGRVALGINVYDYNNTSHLKNGIYKLSLYVDSLLYFQYLMDKFSFDQTRYINDLIDYKTYKTNKERFIMSSVSPGNKLNIYKVLINNGIIYINDDKQHIFIYKAEDFSGNSSSIELKIQGAKIDTLIINSDTCSNYFRISDASHFKNNDIEIVIPENSLYNDICFQYNKKSKKSWSYSNIYSVHTSDVPLHHNFQLSIFPKNLPQHLKHKAVIVSVTSKGNIHRAFESKFENEMLTAYVSEFGDYAIAVDTIAPKITTVNFYDGKDVSKQKNISLKTTDNLSGIQSYNAYMNDEWILMEYDQKNNLLFYKFDENISAGLNNFMLEVIDNADNVAIYKANIIF